MHKPTDEVEGTMSIAFLVPNTREQVTAASQRLPCQEGVGASEPARRNTRFASFSVADSIHELLVQQPGEHPRPWRQTVG